MLDQGGPCFFFSSFAKMGCCEPRGEKTTSSVTGQESSRSPPLLREHQVNPSLPHRIGRRMSRLSLRLLVLFVWCGVLACQQPVSPPVNTSPVSTSALPIIGGQADLRYPEVGALTNNTTPFCTGTLIAKKVVLTAGHCIDAALRYAKTAKVQFRIDIPDASQKDGYKATYTEFDPALFRSHPIWNGDLQNGGDIAVGILKTPVVSALPMAINLAPLPSNFAGQSPLFLGYGLLQSTPTSISAGRKYAANIPVVKVESDRFTHQASGKSVCHGDSGGPALFNIGGRIRVLGVNSYVSAARVPGTTRSTCQGSGTSARTDTYATFLKGILEKYGDGPQACTQTNECGPCSQCKDKLCQPKPVSALKTHCQACRQDSDCQGGICHRFADGYRCLRTCDDEDCCPTGMYCSSLRTNSGLKKLCIPFDGSCPALSCTKSSECGPGEFCENGFCKPQPIAPSVDLCKPCTTDAQCGQGHLCLGLPGHKRCSQACGGGDFCPADMTCEEPSPGLPKQCVPQAGACQRPCQFSSNCALGEVCLQGTCVSKQPGQYGASCDPAPCASPYVCINTLRGKRCLLECGIPIGDPGSGCKANGSCRQGVSCFEFSNNRKACLVSCRSSADCQQNGGGYCSQGVCLCSGDADCRTGNICNGNSGILGACAPRTLLPPCEAGFACKVIDGNTYCVSEAPGTRAYGQSCDALNGCREGLRCTTVPDGSSLCLESCTSVGSCKLGGVCTPLSGGISLCLCQQGSECPKGRTCTKIIQNRYGFCQAPGLSNPCVLHQDCPSGSYCDEGTCKKGEAPPPPPEPRPEPKPEPVSEPQPEPVASEAPKEEAPTNGQEPLADAGEPTPQPDTSAPPPKKGCGCTSTGTPRPDVSWLCLLLLCLPLLRKRRSWPTQTREKTTKVPVFRMNIGVFSCLALSCALVFFAACPGPSGSCQSDDECSGQTPYCVSTVCTQCRQDGDCSSGSCQSGACATSEPSAPEPRPEPPSTPEPRPEPPAKEPSPEPQTEPQPEPQPEDAGPQPPDDTIVEDAGPPEPLQPLPPYQPAADICANKGKDCCLVNTLTRKIELFTASSSNLGSTKLAVSPDGSYFASANNDGKLIRLWRLSDRTLLKVLFGHTSNVRGLAFHPDSKHLASVGSDRIVRIWDLTTGKEVAQYKGHTSTLYALSYSKDGALLASAGSDRTIRVWDTTKGTTIAILQGHTSTIWQALFTPDGKQLVSSSSDRTIRVWDIATSKELRKLQLHGTSVIRAIALSPDGAYIASAGNSSDRTIHITELATGKKFKSYTNAHSGTIYELQYSPDGKGIASVASDRRLKLWDAGGVGKQQDVAAGTSTVYSVAYTPDNKALLTASYDQTIRFFRNPDAVAQETYLSHFDRVAASALSHDQKWVATADAKSTWVRLWDAKTGKLIRNIQGHTSGIRSLNFNVDSTSIVTGSSDGTVKLFDPKTGTTQKTIQAHTMPITAAIFHPDGKSFATASWDRTITLWDTSTGQALRTLKGHTRVITNLAFGNQGQWLASSSVDKTAILWKVADGTQLRVFKGHPDWLYSVAISPDGTTLATGGWNNEVRLFSTSTGVRLRTLAGHTSAIRSLAFSPDSLRLASASYDRSIRLWSTQSGALLRILQPRNHYISHVAFSLDGSKLLSSTWDTNADLWELADAQPDKTLYDSAATHQIAVSPNQEQLATASADGTIKLFRLKDSQLTIAINAHTRPVNAVAYHPSGQLIASGSDDRTAALWTLDGKLLRRLSGHRDRVSSLAFSTDGETLVTGSWDGAVRLWDVAQAKVKHTLLADKSRVLSVSLSHDGTRVAAGTAKGQTLVWDTATGARFKTLGSHTGGVTAVRFGGNANLLFTGSYDKTIKSWEIDKERVIRTFSGPAQGIQSLAVNADGSRLAAGTWDGKIYLWRPFNGRLERVFSVEDRAITGLHLDAPGQTLLLATEGGTLQRYSLAADPQVQSMYRYPLTINAMGFAPGGGHFAAASITRRVRIFRPSDWRSLRSNYTHSQSVGGVAIRPDNQHIATVGEDKRLHTAKLSDGKTVNNIANAHTGAARAVSYSPDSKLIASGSADKEIKIWPADKATALRTLSGHTDAITSLAFYKDSQHLVSGSADKTLKLWDATTGQFLHTMTGHTEAVVDVDFSSDGKWLASVSSDLTLRLWDPLKGTANPNVIKLPAAPTQMRFSPNSFWLAIAYESGTIELRDLGNWQVVRTLQPASMATTTLAWTGDSRGLAAGNIHGWMSFWQCQ